MGSARPPPAERIAASVLGFYDDHKRELPWRASRDAYRVWVSEIMLQQTRVATVIPYYERWMERFPNIAALASAPLGDVLAAWTGLGYYSRARNLHRGAREVVERCGGVVPDDPRVLEKLPGIGRYTAGAIASIAFDRPAPLVDGNVARVLARVYGITENVKKSAGQRALWRLAGELVPERRPGDFNQGLMEIGATVCLPKSPDCAGCPLGGSCIARAEGRVHELPVTEPRTASQDKPQLCFQAALIERRHKLLLAQRNPRGLYGGLWELPQATDLQALSRLIGLELDAVGEAPAVSHRQELSHRRLSIDLWLARARGRTRLENRDTYRRLAWHSPEQLGQLGLSSATLQLMRKLKRYDL